jgi:hypothetical protein
MAAVQQFLATYVAEGDREKAESEMCDLFVNMHSELARKFFTEYKQPAKQHQMAVNLNEVEEEIEVQKKPKQKKAVGGVTEKKMCSGVTAKGKACGNKCFDGGDYCRVHQKVADKAGGSKAGATKKKTEPKKKTKETKQQKVVPVHNHALIEEMVEDCDLCETQGNAMNPELQAAEFEAVPEAAEAENIQSRLAGILAQFDEEQEEEEEEEEETPEIDEVTNSFEKALESDSEYDSDETIDGVLDIEEI